MRPWFGFGAARRGIWRSYLGSNKELHVVTSQCEEENQGHRDIRPNGRRKRRLTLETARRLGGEIIRADSVQVYCGLDVRSAKPSALEMSVVPHHLIDIMHASEDYSSRNQDVVG